MDSTEGQAPVPPPRQFRKTRQRVRSRRPPEIAAALERLGVPFMHLTDSDPV